MRSCTSVERLAGETGAGAGCAAIRVWDTGIGISPEALLRIFDPFVQVSRAPGTNQTGSGPSSPGTSRTVWSTPSAVAGSPTWTFGVKRAGRAGVPLAETRKSRLPTLLSHGLGEHTHRADEDAARQAEIFKRMRAWPPLTKPD